MKISATGQYERAFNKLARTFAAQVETLKRYRGGGEQTMPRGIATARGRRLGARIVADDKAKHGLQAAIASSPFMACCQTWAYTLPATAFFSSVVKGVVGELGENLIKDEHLDVGLRLLLFPEAI